MTYSLALVVLGFKMLAIGFLAELMIALNIRSVHAYNIAETAGTPPLRVDSNERKESG